MDHGTILEMHITLKFYVHTYRICIKHQWSRHIVHTWTVICSRDWMRQWISKSQNGACRKTGTISSSPQISFICLRGKVFVSSSDCKPPEISWIGKTPALLQGSSTFSLWGDEAMQMYHDFEWWVVDKGTLWRKVICQEPLVWRRRFNNDALRTFFRCNQSLKQQISSQLPLFLHREDREYQKGTTPNALSSLILVMSTCISPASPCFFCFVTVDTRSSHQLLLKTWEDLPILQLHSHYESQREITGGLIYKYEISIPSINRPTATNGLAYCQQL